MQTTLQHYESYHFSAWKFKRRFFCMICCIGDSTVQSFARAEVWNNRVEK